MNRTDFKFKYVNPSTGRFKDNTTGDIEAEDQRDFTNDIGDNVLFKDDDVLDEDDMSSDSSTKVPTQQSVKAYVDSEIAEAALGIVTSWKAPVKVATTTNGTLATAYENGDTVDGVTLATGDRILLKNQSSQTENGIYVVNASGAPTRASDANAGAELEGAAVMVQQGTSNANTTWIQTTDGVTIGSSNIVWSQMGTSVSDADESTKGIAQRASQSTVNTATNDTDFLTALKLKNRDGAVAALTPGSTVDITSDKNTLSTSAATITWTISHTGDDMQVNVTLSATGATWTFPSGSLCISEGTVSGDNTAVVSGVSGDLYVVSIRKVGSTYQVAVKNFGQ